MTALDFVADTLEELQPEYPARPDLPDDLVIE